MVRGNSDRYNEKNDDADSDRIRQLLYSYLALRNITNGKNVKVNYKLFEPSGNMGYISVTGKKVEYHDRNIFRAITLLATNFEAYPKTNGTVQLNFTFHGLRNKRGEKQNEQSN